ncbi:hypothetical protein NN561_013596 [Cricetulus griseus]
MGNCLKSPTSDDISLLHESQSDRASFGEGTEPDQEPPPPYQVREGVCWRERRGGSGPLPLASTAWPRGALTPSGLVLRVSAAQSPTREGSFLPSPWAPFGDGVLSLSSGIKLCDHIPLASVW